MQKVISLVVLFLGLVGLPGCGCKSCGGGDLVRKKTGQVVRHMSAEELHAELGSVKLVNVLKPVAFEDCRIPGSINVPYAQLEAVAKQWDKNEPIVVYCASVRCPLSAHAYTKLKSLGFTNVRAYEGGTREWLNKGLPLEGPCAREYLHKPW